MKNFLLGLLLALSALTSFAGPAQEERQGFCANIAYTSLDVMAAKEAGMDRQTFEMALAQLLVQISEVLSASELKEVDHYLREAYASTGTPAATAQRIFDACVNQKQV